MSDPTDSPNNVVTMHMTCYTHETQVHTQVAFTMHVLHRVSM